MPTREVKSDKNCRDCGKMAYSYQVGWVDDNGETIWHRQKNCNQCKECRNKMYKRIEITKKKNRSQFTGEQNNG